ncbi:MAG: zinc ribbon domain-containing protein [Elusimicrobia bacterium]|nr:zinc ribbon domain-containing protein [Elusimicrobiota bacterium]
MTSKPSTIKCPKCGSQPNIITDTCMNCGSKLEKICGECGAAVAVEKNYCDKCGSLLALQPPPRPDAPGTPPPPPAPEKRGFSLEMESIQDTVSERATSFRRKVDTGPAPAGPAAPPPPASKPAASGRSSKGGGSVLSPDSARLMKQAPLPRPVRPPMLKKVTGALVTVLLLGVLSAILYMIAAPSLPKLRLIMTAKAYLSDISEGKFEKAYSLLSTNSKAACSLEEYLKNSSDYYAKAPAWQFKDVEVFAMTSDSAMIRYMLKEGNGEWKYDFISFVRENNRWTRPYIWVLFQPIDDALKRHDFPQALFLAQKLYLTDPVDPRTSGYLCDAEFFMGLHEKAVDSCKRMIDNAAIYPVGYTSAELFQYNSHYADSLRFLQRDRVALQEYDKLLKWPGATSDQLCPVHLNRADSFVYLKEYDRALRELMDASSLCTQSPAKESTRTRLYYMSGSAGPAAVAFAQKSRFQPGQPPIGEARSKELADLKAKLGPRNARLLPKDQWMAVHVAGPEYRVFLRQEGINLRTKKSETQTLYTFLVNLWTGRATVEKAPGQDKPGEVSPDGK